MFRVDQLSINNVLIENFLAPQSHRRVHAQLCAKLQLDALLVQLLLLLLVVFDRLVNHNHHDRPQQRQHNQLHRELIRVFGGSLEPRQQKKPL